MSDKFANDGFEGLRISPPPPAKRDEDPEKSEKKVNKSLDETHGK